MRRKQNNYHKNFYLKKANRRWGGIQHAIWTGAEGCLALAWELIPWGAILSALGSIFWDDLPRHLPRGHN